MNAGDVVHVRGDAVNKYYFVGIRGDNRAKVAICKVHEHGFAVAIANYGITHVNVDSIITERQHKLENLPRIIEDKKIKLGNIQQEIDKLTQELVSYAEQSEE